MVSTITAPQERMKAEHATKSGHMMLAMNKWSVVYLSIGLLATGEGVAFLAFLQRHPAVLGHILQLSVASALGQFFIFMTVSDFGPLPCSIVTTTRKFFTVLASVLLFGNSLVNRQWLGCFFVFAGGLLFFLLTLYTSLFLGIFLDGLYGKQKSQAKAD